MCNFFKPAFSKCYMYVECGYVCVNFKAKFITYEGCILGNISQFRFISTLYRQVFLRNEVKSNKKQEIENLLSENCISLSALT